MTKTFEVSRVCVTPQQSSQPAAPSRGSSTGGGSRGFGFRIMARAGGDSLARNLVEQAGRHDIIELLNAEQYEKLVANES